MIIATFKLKKILLYRFAETNDKSFLAVINTIIETKTETTIYNTTPGQQKKIKEGKEQIAKGEYFTNEQVEMEIDKWITEK